MTDLAMAHVAQELASQIQSAPGDYLWCTDENTLNSLPESGLAQNLRLMTNRWDVAKQANAIGFSAEFNDFDCSGIADNSLDGIFYRVSKEKMLVHHLLNQAWRCLKPGAPLVLAGYKNEGTKTYIEKIAALMGSAKKITKNGPCYSAWVTKQAAYNRAEQLDDQQYSQLRTIEAGQKFPILSKPGLFGWNKIDAGSALLIEQLAQDLNNESAPTSCLDLGCGYGYLTLAAAQLQNCNEISQWYLTDNNAAALIAAERNLAAHHLNGQVVAADAGQGLALQVDLLLCNPPFHQGFSVDGDLTDKFLRSAQQLLQPQGHALFVVNQFIPLERKAAGLFGQIQVVCDNGSFKVIRLGRPVATNRTR